MITIDMENASTVIAPDEKQFRTWVEAALGAAKIADEKELSIRIVDTEESRTLNLQYREKDRPTNVLSFPCDLPEKVDVPLLGDLVICAQVVEREALEQNKSIEQHWAHMAVHGTLHLLGFDHETDSEAEVMERLEIKILDSLGFSNPYETANIHSC